MIVFKYFKGVKEPVFSEDHLSLCNDKTLLLLRTEEEDTLVLLHKAKEGKFTVSLKDSDSDIKVLILLILIFCQSTSIVYTKPANMY